MATMKPYRIQRQRSKGWQKPPNTVCVTRPRRDHPRWPLWGNPFIVGQDGTAADCVRLFIERFKHDLAYRADVCRGLAGKHLACWCQLGDPCHTDVLRCWENASEEKADCMDIGPQLSFDGLQQ